MRAPTTGPLRVAKSSGFYGMAGLLVARATRIAPVSRETILDFVGS